MIQRFKNSWQLVKASAEVLRADKELVVFPIVSAVAVLLVTITFIVPVALATPEDGDAMSALSYLLGFLFYLVTYFIIFFCNSALVGAALIRLRGGDPTVGDGFRIAMEHVGSIFGYALVSATVGMILRTLQERAGFLGRIVVALVGAAWNIATFLVVPILVTEKVGPIQAVRRSVDLLKRTWGEQVLGNAGVGVVFGFLSFLVILISVPLLILAFSSQSLPFIVISIALVGTTLVVLAVVNAALSGIYTAAVYRYAAEGDVGHTFDPQMVRGAFRPR